MKPFVNKNNRTLFFRISGCILVFILFAAGVLGYGLREQALSTESAAAAVLAGSLCMGTAVLMICYRYVREQDRLMENAVDRIREYIAGDREARIECNEEGELYRLFHEINSLAAILNAKAEKEGQSGKFLRNTIADISHQLKTPLAALNIYNGIMQTEAETEELQTIREFAGLSEQELDRIETLVYNLLNITKFDAGTVVMERKQENIAEMMADVKKHFSFRAGQEGKEILLSGSDSVTFWCDRNWIVEAVSNIVKNALDHTRSGGCVRIAWEGKAAMVRITVKDNGSGIHPEDLHHIFKRFYRSRYSKDTQGAGLGLPLAKSVVESHNGTIEVDSLPGAGTTFSMNFLITTKL